MKRLALLLLILPGLAGAQSPAASPELQALQEKYRQLSADATSAVQEQRREALQQLQQRRAAAGSYDSAARAAALLNAKTAAVAVSDGRQPIVLQPVAAELTGSAQNENGGIRLNREGASAVWKTSRAVPGWYDVVISAGVYSSSTADSSYGPTDRPVPDDAALKKERERMEKRAADNTYTKEAGGVVRFELLSGIDAAAPLRWYLTPTGGWYVMKETSLGKIQVRSALANFRLSAELAGASGLAQISEVRLVPANAPAVSAATTTPGTAGPAGEFDRLKETYTKQALEKAAPLKNAWIKTLTRIEAEATQRNDTVTVAKVRAERARLAGGSANPILRAVDPLVCKVRGDAKVNNDRTLLTRMRPAESCQAVWNPALAGVTPGKWHVTVHAMVGKDHGGSFELSTAGTTRTVKVATRNRPRERARKPKPGDGSSDSYEEAVRPGMEEIDAGVIVVGDKDSITLKVLTLVHEDGGLFDLKHIELKPVTKDQ